MCSITNRNQVVELLQKTVMVAVAGTANIPVQKHLLMLKATS